MALPFHTLTIGAITEETAEAKSFTFAADSGAPVLYQPGQYLTLIRPSPQGETRRSYSITSTPVLQEPLTIGVKRIPNGEFSRYLVDTAQVGDKLLTSGAGGFFTLPDDLSAFRQVFFFAAGSGITPVFSLLKTVLHAHPHLSAVLVYSNHNPERAIFLASIEELAKAFPERLHLELLFSVSADLSKARLHKDLIHRLFRQFALGEPKEVLAYLCGPESYMRMCLYALRQIKVPPENIFKENFSTLKRTSRVRPPDEDPHQVTVQVGGATYRFEMQYPSSILQAAQDAGLTLPYSCLTGRCGSCAARCLSGKVWMSYNEVLTKKSLQKGLILTCVGHPIAGDVVLEIL